jgi:hypothetical protein
MGTEGEAALTPYAARPAEGRAPCQGSLARLHASAASKPGLSVCRTQFVPSASMTYASRSPEMSDSNAILLPSGECVGYRSPPR